MGRAHCPVPGDGYTLLVFDVEDPAEPGCGREQARVRSRRIGFYRRHGAHLRPVQGYHAPHGSEWAPMLLPAAALDAGGPYSVAAQAGRSWQLYTSTDGTSAPVILRLLPAGSPSRREPAPRGKDVTWLSTTN